MLPRVTATTVNISHEDDGYSTSSNTAFNYAIVGSNFTVPNLDTLPTTISMYGGVSLTSSGTVSLESMVITKILI